MCVRACVRDTMLLLLSILQGVVNTMPPFPFPFPSRPCFYFTCQFSQIALFNSVCCLMDLMDLIRLE